MYRRAFTASSQALSQSPRPALVVRALTDQVMESSPSFALRLVPGPAQSSGLPGPSSASQSTSHSLHPGAHDTLRYGTRSLSAQHAGDARHPAQDRLERWDETREEMQLGLKRNLFGVGECVRTMMEKDIVGFSSHLPAQISSMHSMGAPLARASNSLSPLSSLHLSILSGTDETLEPRDFLPYSGSGGSAAYGELVDVHGAMEKKLRM